MTLATALCTGGNMFVVLYSISRVSQEVFREAFLPFLLVMASNGPRDALLPVLALSCVHSTSVIVASPSGRHIQLRAQRQAMAQGSATALPLLGLPKAPFFSFSFHILLLQRLAKPSNSQTAPSDSRCPLILKSLSSRRLVYHTLSLPQSLLRLETRHYNRLHAPQKLLKRLALQPARNLQAQLLVR